MEASGILLVSGDDDVGKYIRSINKLGLKIYFSVEKNTGSNIHTRNHA